MCDDKVSKRDWELLRPEGALGRAIADVLDNIGDQTNSTAAREYVKQNLLALVNVTRQVTARQLYKSEMDGAYREFLHYAPDSIKQTLRNQEEAFQALFKTSTASGFSPGTDTKNQSEPF